MELQRGKLNVSLVLILIGLSFTAGDFQCGEGAVRFNNECYLMKRGNCGADSLFIRDQCCRENCVRTCTAENCWHCCETENSSVPKNPVVPCNQKSAEPCLKCSTDCCCGGSPASCNQSGCCRLCETSSTCCQSCCQNCSNCVAKTHCQQTYYASGTSGSQQTNCNQSGSPGQSNGQQTNCGEFPSYQGKNQTTNCSQHTICENCNNQSGGPQINCCGSTSNQGGIQSGNGSPCSAAEGQAKNCGNQNNCTSSGSNQGCAHPQNCNQNCNNGNWPIPPIEPTCSTPPTEPTVPTNSPTTPSPPLTNPATTPIPPPAALQCPPATIPMGRTCRLVYCPKGTIMRNNECIVLVCPAGTLWNGYKCAFTKPTEYNITFTNTVAMQSNASRPDIILNNYHNFTVNIPVTINDSEIIAEGEEDKDCNAIAGMDCGDHNTDGAVNQETAEKSMDNPDALNNSPKCCTVMTPRTCEHRNNRWYCYSRRYQRCGDFCMAPVIYLKPQRVYTRAQHMVVPPLTFDCNAADSSCRHPADGYDCSGCGLGLVATCSQYCYRYSCPSHSCSFYDQQTYCMQYPGASGCLEYDGCFDEEWCS